MRTLRHGIIAAPRIALPLPPSYATMTHYLFIIVGAVLVNNVVLVKILGLCPFMGVSKKLETAFGMGAATTFVLTVATGASYIIDHYLLMPFGLEYLRTLSFIVTIAAIVQLTEMVIQKTSPLLHQVLGIYLPLITTNCAVLGVPLLNIANKNDFVESLLFGAGSAIGFSLVLVLFRRHPRTRRRRRRAGLTSGARRSPWSPPG
jgi:electron transport complex protein RnfA